MTEYARDRQRNHRDTTFVAFANMLTHRLMGLFTQDSTTASSGRMENWGYGIQMVKDHPLGAGGGAYKLLSTSYLPAYLIEHHVGSRASHNTYLLILTEQGIPGMVIFLLLLFF